MSKNSFLKGAAILGIAGMITKVLGAFYRIPLSNLMGTEGLGYYQTAYPLYTLLLAISTSGFPTAISKLISEKRAVEDYYGASRIFKISFIGFLIAGVVTSLFIALFARPIVKLVGNEGGYYALMALVPALFLVPILSSFKGYFQGKQQMLPIAVSQTVEQLFRVSAGLPLAYILLKQGLPQAAGGASFGGTIGALAGMAVIMFAYARERRGRKSEIESSKVYEKEEVSVIAKNIMKIAIPITIGASIVPVINNVDTFLIMRRLQDIGYTAKQASEMFGQLTGNAQTLINLPQVISTALAMSLVPAISEAMARGKEDEMRKATKSGIRMTLLFGLPSAIGIFVLATPIMQLLYYGNTLEEQLGSGAVLQVLAISLVFLTLIQSLTAILQGLGKPMVPVRNLVIGLLVKIVLTYVLTGIPALNIKGAAASTVITYMVAAVLNYAAVIRLTGSNIEVKNTVLKPLMASVVMGVVAYGAFYASEGMLGSKLATLVSIAAGGASYVILLLKSGAVVESDFDMFPKGDKLFKMLKKLKLVK